MIGWSSSYNWTYEEFINVVTNALEIEKIPTVSLDVEHSDRRNMDDIIRWANENGYHATEASGGDIIKVTKRGGINEP